MGTKKKRIDVLRYILANKQYDHQEDILEDLRAQGFSSTQPTLSRDMRELKVKKMSDGKGHSIYILPQQEVNVPDIHYRKSKVMLVQNFGFLKAMRSGNLIVVRTLHGYASSLAAELDNNNLPGVLGTIAGDDTVLLVLDENVNLQLLINNLHHIIPQFRL